MAEGVFRSLVKSNPRVGDIDSCGTGAYHSSDPPNPRTMKVLRGHGITDYQHAARQVTLDDFKTFDYIFAMDQWNLEDLQELAKRARGGNKAKVMLFGEFSGTGSAEEVADPYSGPDSGFHTAYEQVRRFSQNFIAEVIDGKD